MNNVHTFRANGKLLISGEYFVLDGAKALAFPTQRGQVLKVQQLASTSSQLHWQSYTNDDQVWFECEIEPNTFEVATTSDVEVSNRLVRILKNAQAANPSFLKKNLALKVETHLEFGRDWGLGSSSTLICTIAKWANVDAFKLLFSSMKGSGYDIACGMHDHPIIYTIKNQEPTVQRVHFDPPFKARILFVHLGKKQNSRAGIKRYREKMARQTPPIETINDLTAAFLNAAYLEDFNAAIRAHEALVSKTIELPRAKDLYFDDYTLGEVKSLGAWGGDFVMASCNTNFDAARKYFHEKGFPTCISYADMLLSI